jgi:cyclin T
MYFTRDAIDASLGAHPEAEARERQLMCAFIQNTGMRLALPQLAIATAVVFFHRFYASATAVRPNDKFVAATACLFLAGKVEEIPKYLEVVLPEAYATHYPTRKRLVVGTPEYKMLRLSVLASERAVLSAIAFDLTVQHPYTNLLAIIKQIAPLPSDATEGSEAAVPASSTAAQAERKQLAQAAWNFVNDSLRTTLCLQYEPMLIAVAAVYMAAKVTRTAFALTVDKAGVSRPWYEGFGARLEVLDAISKEMVSMYTGDECPPHISKLVKDETGDGGATNSSVNTSKRASPTHTSASVSPKRRSPSTLAELPPPHLLHLARDEDNDAIFANNGDDRAAADTSNATTSTSTSPPPVGDVHSDLLTGLGGGDDGKSPHVLPSNGKPSLSPPMDEIVAMVEHESPDDAVVGVPKLLHAMEAAVEDERSVMRRMPTSVERRVPRAPSERFNPM